MRLLLSLCIVLAWQAYPGIADACTCWVGGTYPADGETLVPVDAEVFVYSSGEFYGDPALSTVDGESVPTRVRTESGINGTTWYFLAPLEPLSPQTEYSLVGSLGSPVVRFTTGKGRSALLPEPADVLAFSSAASDLSTCEPGLCYVPQILDSSWFRYRPAYAAAYYEIVVTVSGETWRRLAPSDFYGVLHSGFCGGAPEIGPGDTACAQLVAVGASGLRNTSGEIVCSEAKACEASSECDQELLSNCISPDFETGAIETPKVNGAGCSVGGEDQASTMWFLLLVAVCRIRRQ